jgi:hypothetical protein
VFKPGLVGKNSNPTHPRGFFWVGFIEKTHSKPHQKPKLFQFLLLYINRRALFSFRDLERKKIKD